MASTSHTASPSKPTGENIRFFHFGDVERIKGRYGYYKEANVVFKRHPRKITQIRMSDSFEDMKSGFKMGTEMMKSDDGNYRFSQRSKILTCGQFDYDTEMLEAFQNPPVTHLSELKTMPIGSRISVQGKVVRVSEHCTAELKTVTLEEDMTTTQLKLWGIHSRTEVMANDVIKVQCCTLKQYQQKLDLNSTNKTNIVVVEQPEEKVTGCIEAIGFDDELPMVYVNDNLYQCSRRMIDTMFPEKEIPNGPFTLSVKGDVVLSMTPVEDKEVSE